MKTKNYSRYQITARRGIRVLGGLSGFDFTPAYFTRRGIAAPATRAGRLVLGNDLIVHAESTKRAAVAMAKKMAKEFTGVRVFNTESGEFIG